MKNTTLELLEQFELLTANLDSIGSQITYNRGKVDSINEQIKTLTALRIDCNALIVAQCKEFDDTIRKIKTIKYHTENTIT